MASVSPGSAPSTKIGPASGLWYRTEALGERLYIHKRFHKDIAAADGAPT